MKIGIDARYLTGFGGPISYATNLVENLALLDHENEYLLYTDREINLKRISEKLAKRSNFKVRIVKGPFQLWWLFSLPIAVKRDDIDVFHSILPIENPILRKYARIVVTVHDLELEYRPQDFSLHQRLILRPVNRVSIANASKVLTPSQSTKMDLINIYKVDEEKIKVIPLAADEFFKPLDKSSTALKIKKFYGIEKFILYVGEIRAKKNVSRLLLAYYRLRKHFGINHKLVLIVPAKHPYYRGFGFEEFLDLVKTLRLDGHVLCLEKVPKDHLLLFYNAAEAFVFPSLSEGFGLAVLEAMACGNIVVASNSSSLPEVIGDAGILVNPYDVNGIVYGMYKAVSDENLRRTLRDRALKRARMFNWRDTSNNTLKVYKEAYLEQG